MVNKKNNKESDRIGVRKIGRTIYFFADVDADSVCEACLLIQDLENDTLKKPIEFVICSDGGNCYDGLALYDKLRSSDAEIITVASGLVASMGVIIYLAGDVRYATENTRFMVHQISTGGEFRLQDAEIDLKETKSLEDIMLEINADRTGKSLKTLKLERKNGDKYFSAYEGVEEGYVDSIVVNKKTPRRKRYKKK